jgi:nitrite reductase (NADH) large subunit
MTAHNRPRLIVIGNGMVGQKFLQLLHDAGGTRRYAVTTFCEEPRPAYDRVHLSEVFAGRTPDDLAMTSTAWFADAGIDVRIGVKAVAIDRTRRMVTASDGSELPYDRIVLATGSYPFVPPVPGKELPGCCVYRTIEDLDAIRTAAGMCRTGVVVGGGLLGLEAANALKNLGLDTHVVEFAPQLMGVQIDVQGGALLKDMIEALGVKVHLSKSTTAIVAGDDGRVSKMTFADGSELPTGMIVFSAGIRPRDELAKAAGLTMGQRGGVVIDDHCRTSDPDIQAIGEVALWKERIFGLVAPGNTMAQVAVDHLMDHGGAGFQGADMSTKLKLMGLDVASFGDSHGRTPGSRSYRWSDEVGRVYKRIVVSADGKTLLGGILVGDAEDYSALHQVMLNAIPLPEHPETLILPASAGAKPALGGPDSLPDSAIICSCNNVTKKQIVDAIAAGNHDIPSLKSCTKACTGCGGCTQLTTNLLKSELKKAGVAVNNHLCEHFAYSRQELYHLVRSERIGSFQELLARHGKGDGCEICKPAVGSILASTWNEHVLRPEHAPLQDSNDHFLANIQKDGTYSVVPRVPGGEITPDQLIAIGQTAKRYDLYTKITGGQRIDLFGARADQLPDIWRELLAAGFESGHAYGKAFRTCKTCVGSTWCRYGQQDSVGLGVRIEHRYKGLRAPHKLKMAVSGCTRECAEAQGKDVGIIATEKGYNLYVCGNGGMKPRHAEILAQDLTEEQVFRYTDRLLMFYIRTADKLERTATWFDRLEGGLDYLKAVVIDDSLGLAAQFEAEMQHIVDTYQDEWRTVVEDPAQVARFKTFVNAPDADPDLAYVRERGQRRPASASERLAAVS